MAVLVILLTKPIKFLYLQTHLRNTLKMTKSQLHVNKYASQA